MTSRISVEVDACFSGVRSGVVPLLRSALSLLFRYGLELNHTDEILLVSLALVLA
jgi:hypothetical protein